MKFPNTVIIGAQKSSTTWIQRRLAQHPDVYMVPGEVNYFDREGNFSLGPEWYARHFRKSGDAKIVCEKTADYIWTTCDGVPGEPADKPERMHALLPDAKLIVILRDPVRRALSGWNHYVCTGMLPATLNIETLLEPSNHPGVRNYGIVQRGLYHAQLSRFLECYKRLQILVLYQEIDVVENPSQGLKKLCSFLDLDHNFRFQGVCKRENETRSSLAGVFLKSRTTGTPRRLMRVLDRRVLRRLPFLPRVSYPSPSESLLERLRELYEDDIRKLDRDFGPVPDAWRN